MNGQKEKMSKEVVEEFRPRKTIVIFGVSSFVGSNLAEILKKFFKVVGTYKSTKVKIPGVLTVPCDVLSKDEVQFVLFAFKPDIAIYCVGLSSIAECADRPELADALNTSGVFNVVEYCQRYKAQICYLSSNFVFAGEERKYIEMDIPDATTIYGKTQAQAEFYIQKTSLNYVLFRTCRLYGRGIHPHRQKWFEKIQKNMSAGENVTADSHVKVGFLDIHFLAGILKLCFEKGAMNRLFQVSSSDIMSHYEFARLYCKTFDDPESAVVKTKWKYPVVEAHALDNLSEELFFQMDTGNIEGYLNVLVPSIEDSLQFTYKRMNGSQGQNKKNQGEGISFI